MEEKLGVMVVDGELINLDKAPIEKMKTAKSKLNEKEKKIRAEIEKLMKN